MEIGRLHHVTICVADFAATRHFYTTVLGMEEVERPATFQFKGQWFRKNGAEIHTIHRDDAGQKPGDGDNIVKPARDLTFARHICFSIADIDAAVQTLESHGVEIAIPPRPRGDGAIQLYLYDPDGHLIELVQDSLR